MIEGVLASIGITGALAAALELGLLGLAVKEGYDLITGK